MVTSSVLFFRIIFQRFCYPSLLVQAFPGYFFSQFGWIAYDDKKSLNKWVSALAIVLPSLWILTFLFVKLPGFMVLSGGVVGSVLLLVVIFASIKFRIKNKGLKLTSGSFSEIMFWLSVTSILAVSCYGIFKLL